MGYLRNVPRLGLRSLGVTIDLANKITTLHYDARTIWFSKDAPESSPESFQPDIFQFAWYLFIADVSMRQHYPIAKSHDS
jgi:hypothetical protein